MNQPPPINCDKPSRFDGWIERGGPWVWIQNILTLAVLALGPAFYGRGQYRAVIAAGALLFGVAAAFGLAGVRALGRNRTPFPKPLDDAHLVEHGIYTVVRHPLYSGLIFMALGWTWMWWSWPALLASMALSVLLDTKARVEERWLREKLPGYDAYASRVKRFIPGVY